MSPTRTELNLVYVNTLKGKKSHHQRKTEPIFTRLQSDDPSTIRRESPWWKIMRNKTSNNNLLHAAEAHTLPESERSKKAEL